MSGRRAIVRRIAAALIILVGSAALLGLRMLDKEESAPCEDNSPSFLRGTFDDCQAVNPKPVPNPKNERMLAGR